MTRGSGTTRKGAQFYKADLHTHTPASGDISDRTKTGKDFVESALRAGLEIVAVTDHNTAEGIEEVRRAARGTALHVFPGIEVTTPICHVLAIFDQSTPKNKLDDFLSAIGITTDKRGKLEAMSAQPEIVLGKISEFGGLAIASHANSNNGLLKYSKGQYKIDLYHRDDLAALEFAAQEDIEKFSKGKISNYAAKACTQGSDAHTVDELGRRFTYLKMDGVSLRGIEQALLDYELRVRFPWNYSEANYPRIMSFCVNQGFFGGTIFQFHENLNCFVGGKGTGKSTVIEFMRYCFGDISAIEDIAEDTQGKVSTLLGAGGKATVHYLDADGETKIIDREAQPYGVDRLIRDTHGNPAALLVEPVFFSQGELTRIAASPIAQMELIDRYIDVSAENTLEKDLVDHLNANAAQLQEATSRMGKLKDEIEDPRTGLAATKLNYEGLEKTLKSPILRDFPKWESEHRYVNSVTSGLRRLTQEFVDATGQIDLKQLFPMELPTASPNYEALKPLVESVSSLGTDITQAQDSFGVAVESKVESVEVAAKAWKRNFEKKKAEHESTLESIGEIDHRKAQANLRKLRERLDDLNAKQKLLGGLVQEVKRLEEKRTHTIRELAQARGARFQKRETKANGWQEAFEGRIKVNVIFCGNRHEYLQSLKVLSKGARLRETDLNAIAKSIIPDRLVQLIREEEHQQLAEMAEISLDNAQKFIAMLRSRNLQELLELETVLLPDHPEIKFEVGAGRYKELRELSVGQKGTVIISLALVEGQAPLVIDQPEEPLDTLSIYDQVVGTLRKQKDSRQFVFTTHNPNVAVGADSELNYVLDATADRGRIESSGGVDAIETNKLLLVHLEGGRKAFDLRARKYR